MASELQDARDRVDTSAEQLDNEYEILYSLVAGVADDPGVDAVALALAQAKRTQRSTQRLTRALASLRDVLSV